MLILPFKSTIFCHKKEPIIAILLTYYRLCILVSGSLITEILNCFTLILVSCLHLGQNSGKFSIIVSSHILTLVLLPHTGHNIHSYLRTLAPHLSHFINSFFHSLVNLLVIRFLIYISISL